MRLTIEAASSLARQALGALGYEAGEAAPMAHHLIDCELRGLTYGGLAGIISIGERLTRIGDRRAPMQIVRETPVSAKIDGGDQIGYLVAHRATRLASNTSPWVAPHGASEGRFGTNPICFGFSGHRGPGHLGRRHRPRSSMPT